MLQFLPKRIALACAIALLCASFAAAGEQATPKADSNGKDAPQDTSFRVDVRHGISFAGAILPHHSLKNSSSLHSWPLFAFAMPVGWNSSVRLQKDLGIASIKGLGSLDFSFIGLNLKTDVSVELIHLLELGIEGNAITAFNYGSFTLMGVYDPGRESFDNDIFMTEFAYSAKYHASLVIPLLAILPKSTWTKIILRPNASLTYSAYTGAGDGEVWRAGFDYMINGYCYQYGGTLIYMLPFKHFPMAMLTSNVRGFVHPSDFDDAYSDYDPGFKKIAITPMLSLKVNDKWSGMLMANFTRDRVYENYHYKSSRELSQKRIGYDWTLKAIVAVLTRKF